MKNEKGVKMDANAVNAANAALQLREVVEMPFWAGLIAFGLLIGGWILARGVGRIY